MPPKHHQGSSSGRTVKARELQYIQRQADDELLDHCQNGRPAYILHSPQMGKSSLIAHTAERLNATSHHAVLIDLSQFPLPPREEEWFDKIVRILDDSLDLSTDPMSWWEHHQALSPQTRISQLITEVILPETPRPLVLFIDEIERTIALPFREHFFEWLSFLYESRATNSLLYRLSFVICGVATPSQLIPEGPPSIFQWSHRVVLSDFTLQEALPLAEGLSLPTDAAIDTVKWIYRWTNGHPYLTQLLCRLLEEQHHTAWLEEDVDDCIRHFIASPQGRQEPNFQFVRTALTEPAPNGPFLLEPYLDLLEGKPETLRANPTAWEQLRFVGILRDDDKEIAIRNTLYQEVFPSAWVKRHLRPLASVTPSPAAPPVASPPPTPQHSYVMAASVLLIGVGLLLWFFRTPVAPPPSETSQHVAAASKTSSSALPALAEIPKSPQPPEALTQAQVEHIQELEATIARYQQLSTDESQSLRAQRTQLETQLVSKDNALSDLQDQVKKLESALTNQRDSHDHSIASLQAERAQWQTKATTSAKELNTTLEELKALQMTVLKQSPLAPSEITKLMTDRSHLETQLKTANMELALAHERARELDSLLTQQKQLVQAESQRHLEDRARLETSIKEMGTTVADIRKTLSVKEATARAQESLAKSELSRLQQDRAKYQDLLSASQQELSSLKVQTAKLESSLAQNIQAMQEDARERAALTTKLQDLRSKESRTDNRLSQLEALLTQERETATNTLNTVQQERDQLQTQLSQAQRELNSTKTQVATLGDQLSTIGTQAEHSQNALKAIHASSSEQTRRTEERVSELASVRSTLQTQLQENLAALTQAQERIRQLESNSGKITEAQASLRKITEERDSYSQKLQGTQQQLAKAQDQIKSLEQSLRAGSSTAKNLGMDHPGSSTSANSLYPSSPNEEDVVKAVSSITAQLTQSPSPIKSETARLLWARQAYLFSLQLGQKFGSNIDPTLRSLLPTAPKHLQGPKQRLHALTFNRTGDLLIGGADDGSVLIWDPVNSSLPQKFFNHSSKVLAVAFGPDSQHFASGGQDSNIRLWKIGQAAKSAKLLQAHIKAVTTLAFSPDGKTLASGGQDHSIRLWDLTADKPNHRILGTHSDQVNALVFTPNGQHLISAGKDTNLYMWDLNRPGTPPKILGQHSSDISTLAIHPFLEILAVGALDRPITIWDLSQDKVVPSVFNENFESTSQLEFSPNGEQLAALSPDNKIHLWNWQEPSEPQLVLSQPEGQLERFAMSPNGLSLAGGGKDVGVTLWSSTSKLAEDVCDKVTRNLSLDEWKQLVDEKLPYERTCGNLPLHPTFLEEGKKLAEQGNKEKALSIFTRAKELDPYLEFEPKKEVEKLSTKAS